MRANGTATTLPSKDLVKEINALKAQLKKLSSAMEVDASEGVNRAVDAVGSKSKQAIDDMIESAQGFIDDYSDSARGAVEALTQKSAELRDKAHDSLVETVQNRPFATLAAIVGIGFLAGFLCRRPPSA